MMSATILDKDAFCKSLGLAPEDVKFIQVPSDFPLQNRPIIPLNIEYLNRNSLQKQEVQIKIARAIDDQMTLHRNDKGIIHTTSYKQLNFIKENISQSNRCRLLKTDPDIARDEVITELRVYIAWYPELRVMNVYIGHLKQVSHSSFYRTKTK